MARRAATVLARGREIKDCRALQRDAREDMASRHRSVERGGYFRAPLSLPAFTSSVLYAIFGTCAGSRYCY